MDQERVKFPSTLERLSGNRWMTLYHTETASWIVHTLYYLFVEGLRNLPGIPLIHFNPSVLGMLLVAW